MMGLATERKACARNRRRAGHWLPIALALARAGADVAVAARTRQQLEAVAGEINRWGSAVSRLRST